MQDTPSLSEAARAIRAGTLSPVALTEHCLGVVERLDGRLNAFVTLTASLARQAAEEAEKEIRAGRWRGPLHGIPIGIKDVIDVAGVPTTAQSRQLDGYVPTRNASAVQGLLDAGAVLMGKLTTHEFAFGTPKWGPPGPPARNPWNLERFAGGSSSGAAVATATGMVLGAIGTDTAGSVRSPAALCGVAGFKPVRARIDASGVFPLARSLDTVGCLARTTEDCAALIGVDISNGIADLAGLRIGVIRHFHELDAPASDDAIAAIDEAVAHFRTLGCRVEDVTVAPLAEWNAVGMILLLAEAFALHEPWLRDRPERYGESLRDALLLGAGVQAADYLQALEHRTRLAAALEATFQDHDLLLAAIQPGEAAPLDAISKWGFIERPSLGIPFNVSDHPALSLCCGFGRLGLPLAFQLVGRRADEMLLLRAGHAYEASTPWHSRRPGI